MFIAINYIFAIPIIKVNVFLLKKNPIPKLLEKDSFLEN